MAISKAKQGRPCTYTAEIARDICEKLAEGRTLKEICREEGMPPESTVRLWALDDREGFAALYARSREIGYHSMADDTLEISDDGRNDWMERNGEDDAGWAANGEHLQRSRLRVDTRKWLLSKALPKVYGDKLAIGGAEDLPAIKHEDVTPGDKVKAHIDQIAKRLGAIGDPAEE